MIITRRRTLELGLSGLAGIGVASLLPRFALAQEAGPSQTYPAEGGDIVIHPVAHASFVMETPGLVIYVDPVGSAELYADLPAADLVLITHEHGDHFDLATVEGVAGDSARLIANPAVFDMLTEELQGRATAMANGATGEIGGVGIEAIPAYNTTEDRLNYHPQGRDNGYIVNVAGRRIYIAGDTEDIPEMRALTDIDIAFVPMNLPYTMDEAQAASAAAEFAPATVYVYHYGESDLDRFASLLAEEGGTSDYVRGNWYPA